MGTSKKPHLVLDSNFSAATALSKCSRSLSYALSFCRLVSTKNFFVNFLELFLRGALITIYCSIIDMTRGYKIKFSD